MPPLTDVEPGFQDRIIEAMKGHLARLLDRDEPIDPGMRLMDELGLSSSLALELLLELEEQLEIQIDVEQMDADPTDTVADLAGYIAGHSIPA